MEFSAKYVAIALVAICFSVVASIQENWKWWEGGIFMLIVVVVSVSDAFMKSERRESRAKRSGEYARRFVFVQEDGAVRELTEDERTYLNEEVSPTAHVRPYIKPGYRKEPPHGRMEGFLHRSKVPANVTWIGPRLGSRGD